MAGDPLQAKVQNPRLAHFSKSVSLAAVTQAALPKQTVAVLKHLTALFGLSQILGNMGDFMESGHLTTQQASLARAAHFKLLKQLRPEAVGLVDAFAIPDYVLDSSLGRYDGDVYRCSSPKSIRLHCFTKHISKGLKAREITLLSVCMTCIVRHTFLPFSVLLLSKHYDHCGQKLQHSIMLLALLTAI